MAQNTELQRTLKFWETSDPEMYTGRPRATIPDMPAVGDPIQTYTAEQNREKTTLVYLACAIRDTKSPMVVMQALASAVSILFRDNANYTGSPVATVPLTGLDPLHQDDV